MMKVTVSGQHAIDDPCGSSNSMLSKAMVVRLDTATLHCS
jgi:hypothetical protein